MVNIPFFWTDKELSSGLDINVVAKRTEISKGVDITGFYRESVLNTSGIYITGGYNKAGLAKGFLFQIGLVNSVERIEENSTVIQIGAYNEASHQKCPLINIVGLKNLQKSIKHTLEWDL